MPYSVEWLGAANDVGIIRYHEVGGFGDKYSWVIVAEDILGNCVHLHGALSKPPKVKEFILFLKELGFEEAIYEHNNKRHRIVR